jgi:hypothetical protein
MAETILITNSDVQEIENISPTFISDRFNAFATRVQRIQLRELLGDALWYDFFQNITDAKYVTLRDGGTYTNCDNETVQYFGLKPFITYHWLVLYVSQADYFASNIGGKQFREDGSFDIHKYKRQIRDNYLEEAIRFRNNITAFLNENESTYPLWNTGDENGNVTEYNLIVI